MSAKSSILEGIEGVPVKLPYCPSKTVSLFTSKAVQVLPLLIYNTLGFGVVCNQLEPFGLGLGVVLLLGALVELVNVGCVFVLTSCSTQLVPLLIYN